jgi:membrane-bound ClpP family serine protease
MAITGIILLILIGLFLIVLEVFLLPGLIAGILGFLLMTTGLIWAYMSYGATYGNLILAGIVLLFSYTIFWTIKSGIWKKVLLSEEIEGKASEIPDFIVKGQIGETVSRLAPRGTIRVDGVEMEAKSQEGFIDQGVEIILVSISNSCIVVKRK